jgi:fused signal recognition particle receptor
MSRMHNIALSAALLVSVLGLSACATKSKEVAAEPAPVAAPAEQTAAPEPAPAPAVVSEQPAPAPVASAEQLAPKPVIKKHRRGRKKARKAKVVPAPVVVAAPVAASAPVPAPVAQPETPPPPAPVAVTPIQKPVEPGFLERYWLFFLAIILVIIGAFFLMRKKD